MNNVAQVPTSKFSKENRTSAANKNKRDDIKGKRIHKKKEEEEDRTGEVKNNNTKEDESDEEVDVVTKKSTESNLLDMEYKPKVQNKCFSSTIEKTTNIARNEVVNTNMNDAQAPTKVDTLQTTTPKKSNSLQLSSPKRCKSIAANNLAKPERSILTRSREITKQVDSKLEKSAVLPKENENKESSPTFADSEIEKCPRSKEIVKLKDSKLVVTKSQIQNFYPSKPKSTPELKASRLGGPPPLKESNIPKDSSLHKVKLKDIDSRLKIMKPKELSPKQTKNSLEKMVEKSSSKKFKTTAERPADKESKLKGFQAASYKAKSQDVKVRSKEIDTLEDSKSKIDICKTAPKKSAIEGSVKPSEDPKTGKLKATSKEFAHNKSIPRVEKSKPKSKKIQLEKIPLNVRIPPQSTKGTNVIAIKYSKSMSNLNVARDTTCNIHESISPLHIDTMKSVTVKNVASDKVDSSSVHRVSYNTKKGKKTKDIKNSEYHAAKEEALTVSKSYVGNLNVAVDSKDMDVVAEALANVNNEIVESSAETDDVDENSSNEEKSNDKNVEVSYYSENVEDRKEKENFLIKGRGGYEVDKRDGASGDTSSIGEESDSIPSLETDKLLHNEVVEELLKFETIRHLEAAWEAQRRLVQSCLGLNTPMKQVREYKQNNFDTTMLKVLETPPRNDEKDTEKRKRKRSSAGKLLTLSQAVHTEKENQNLNPLVKPVISSQINNMETKKQNLNSGIRNQKISPPINNIENIKQKQASVVKKQKISSKVVKVEKTKKLKQNLALKTTTTSSQIATPKIKTKAALILGKSQPKKKARLISSKSAKDAGSTTKRSAEANEDMMKLSELRDFLSVSKPINLSSIDGRGNGANKFEIPLRHYNTFKDLHRAVVQNIKNGVAPGVIQDPKRRMYGFLPGQRKNLLKAGIKLQAFGELGEQEHKAILRDYAVDLVLPENAKKQFTWAQEENNFDHIKKVTASKSTWAALQNVTEQVKTLVAERYRSYTCTSRLVAVQPNLPDGAPHLPLHLDFPRHDGFGVVIVIMALFGDSSKVIIVDDGEEEGEEISWSFSLRSGEGYVLSGDARNLCRHGVLCDKAAEAANVREAFRIRSSRKTLILRYGLHSEEFASSEITKYWK